MGSGFCGGEKVQVTVENKYITDTAIIFCKDYIKHYKIPIHL